MAHPISEEVQRLADRLRMAADEIESAARFGVPIPDLVSVSGHKYGGLSFAANEHEFAAWVDYAEADVREYDYAGRHWSSVDAVYINGLPVRFSLCHDVPAVSA